MKQKILFCVKIFVVLALLALLGAWSPLIGYELLEMPKDFSYSADVVSYDNLYNAQTQQFSGKTQSKTTFSYKTVATEENGDVNIIEALFDVRTQDGAPIFSVKRYYGVNHDTYQHTPGYGNENREGYLFGPVKSKADFTYWQINYNQPLTMVFQNEETILGLNTYHFRSDFKADQTADLTSMNDVGKTKGINLDGTLDLWIEPTTGYLVKYEDSATAYYYNLANGERLAPWNQFSNQYNFDSVVKQVAKADGFKTRTFVITEVVPGVLFALIAAFTAWCAFDAKKIWNLRASGLILSANSAAVMISVIIVSAWLINGSSDLIKLFGATTETNPISAVFILIICLSNLFIALKKQLGRKQILVLNVLLAIIIGVSLANIICSILGIKFILEQSGAPVPAAVSFGILLLAVAGVISNINQMNRKRVIAHEVITGLVLLQGVISIIVNVYQFSYAQVETWYGPLNIFTAALFILLAIAQWDVGRTQIKPFFVKAAGSRPWGFALLFVFAGVIATGFIWRASQDAVFRTIDLRFENDTLKIKNSLAQQLGGYTNALLGAKSLFNANSNNVTREAWKLYVDGLGLNESYPGDQGLGYAEIVPAAQKLSFEQQQRSQGVPDYTIKPAQPQRDVYAPVVYIEPAANNGAALGLDMYADPARATAAMAARDSDAVVMSGKVQLALDIPEDQRIGFVLFAPIYRSGTGQGTVGLRQNNIQGYVTNPVRIAGLMQAAVGNQNSGVAIAVYDTSDATQLNSNTLLYDSNPGTDYSGAEFNSTTELTNDGRTWTIRFANLPGYVATTATNASNYALISGLGISALLGVAFFALASSRQRALELARKITADLVKEKNEAVRLQRKDEAILTSIGEGLILYNTQGIIERINGAALKMLGREESEVVGHKLTDALRAMDPKKQVLPLSRRPSVLAVENNTPINTKLLYARKDGSTFPAEITVAPILSGQKAIGAIEVFRDITAEVALDQAKSDFISLASHQLRTPLTANKWYLETLLSGDAGKLSSKQSKIVQDINISNERLIELVVSLLNVTRIESGRLAVNPKPVQLRKIIDGAVRSVEPKLKAKNQKLSVEVPHLPDIMLDENMIRQVVLNLLTNAVKYSPNKTKIAVKVERQESHLLCEVSDQGYGIPADQQKRMFEKFFWASNVTQKEPDGNGLGLYLVKQIVEASGGKIWFTSEQNKGTSFYFTLPFKGVHAKKGEVTLEERANL